MFKKLSVLLICTILIITQAGCISKEPVSKTDFYLNTVCSIEIREMDKSKAEELIDNAFVEIGRYEGLLSRTIAGTDIYKLNNAAGQQLTVSPETAEVMSIGYNISKDTNGLFDITVGQLTNLWNFSSESPKVPTSSDVKTAIETIGYKNLHLHETTASLKNPNTWIDLGAIAKGYIADRVSQYLVDNGVTCGIVDLGGNIVTIGTKEDGSKWNIGIEAPYSDRTEAIGGVPMENQTLVTSGTYERFFEEDGKKYHHILDPATGYPIDSDIVSVSILGDIGSSVYCDGYSTTCLLLGTDKAVDFMKDKKGFEYCILDTDGKIHKSEGFDLQQ